MLRRFLQSLILLATLGLISAPVSAQLHKDERLGYAIRVPKKWKQMPLSTGEQWVYARFESNRTDTWNDDTMGWSRRHVASLRVIGFVDEFINGGKQGPKADKEGEEAEEPEEEEEDDDDEGSSTEIVYLSSIYQNYDEFLKENFRGGYYISQDSEIVKKGVPVRKLELRAEESGENGHRLVHTWIYTTDIGKIAVEFEVLESAYKKNKPSFDKTFNSFQIIPRTKKLTLANTFGEFLSSRRLREMTPEERANQKREMANKSWKKITEDLMDGWAAMEIDEFKVLTRHDKKHAKDVVEHMQGVCDWLEATFPNVGRGEYVRQPIIRICKDWQEELSFRRNSSTFGFYLTEIVTHKDTRGATGFEWNWINRRIMDNWFRQRDRDLSLAMPAWLGRGLSALLGKASVKGSKLKFNEHWWERGFRDDDKEWDLEKVMTQTAKSLSKTPTDNWVGRGYVQATALVRFLVAGAGARGKYKGFLSSYMDNVSAVIHELDKKDRTMGRSGGKAATTEEEEDAQLKARRGKLEAREKEILAEAFKRTAEEMKPATLKSLTKAYAKTIK